MRAFLVLFALAAGCGGPPDPRPVARDLVCLREGDLGCVRVRVDGKTPRSVHQGKTYYFCADACRVKFERDPGKYVALEKE